ncbi:MULTISPECIES: flagellar basal-body rod protein FlgF [Dyella]|uniref:Flagellar basal-body rod protein FlgF n=2 Tax=Dyella TaxID=231454 RepID=A0A4R0YN36_9GAMM|nr:MULTISPECIES: flagellar basal-body rod protein FlgF [Dyella]TBR37184.1 flagellar basal-body rod protein FlgF [Dyella terrae]TCI07726.1 flagellar basal-body rod protein FlgF [Dyella soli]
MDRSIYVAMTGATQMMRAQTEVAHNLANANTVGFKAQMSAFQPLQVLGDGMPSRINGVAQGTGWDMRSGPQTDTGNSLDVAVQGQGWLAVQAPDGSEAYTRAGQLQLTPDGVLTDARGNPVMGDGGPITIPQSSQIMIGNDGTVSAVPMGQGPDTLSVVGKLKLVNPQADQLQPGNDGLMHLADGGTAAADETVQVKSGAIEMSNVNPSQTLVQMIQLSRQYELQVKAIRTADDNAQSASRLLQVS